MLLNAMLWSTALGYTILICGAMFVKVRVEKESAKRRLEWATEETEQIRKEIDETNEIAIAEKEEHKKKMEKIYADADEFLNKYFGKPLEDDEVVALHELFERAKRDDRFKENLKGIKLSDIYYEAMFISCRRVKELTRKAIEKWENGGDSNE